MKNHTHPYTKHDLLVEVPSLGVVRDIGKEGVTNMTLQLLLNQVRCQQNLDIYPYPKYGSTLCIYMHELMVRVRQLGSVAIIKM